MKHVAMLLFGGILLFHCLLVTADDLSADDFSRIVRSLSSIASETTLFLDQLEQGQLTNAYAKTHREKLKDELDDARHKLDKPSPAVSKLQHDNSILLADALIAEIDKLNGQLQEKTRIRKAKDEVVRIHQSLARLRA
jgi:chromosome segregation ATPase